MDVNHGTEPEDAETRFRAVFARLGDVTAYARRRGSPDPDAIAAEAMTIAWRRLADVPRDDPRPWLFATARNLLLAERRQRPSLMQTDPESLREADFAFHPAPEARALDPDLAAALHSLRPGDCEALLLVAWEDLSPSLAAKSLGISQAAFRVRLHRARRRFRRVLEAQRISAPINCPEMQRS
jgi:RNA polymerase sigma-70 factor, ECF subfamily